MCQDFVKNLRKPKISWIMKEYDKMNFKTDHPLAFGMGEDPVFPDYSFRRRSAGLAVAARKVW